MSHAASTDATPPRRRRGLWIAGGVLAGVAVLYAGGVAAAGTGVARGTTVLGIDIGGMSRDQAIATLNKGLAKKAQAPMTVTAVSARYTLDPVQSGLRLDAPATVDAAEGSSWNPITLVASLTGRASLDPVVRLDEAKMTDQLQGLATAIDRAPVEPQLAYEGLTPKVTDGQDGRGLDLPAAAEKVAESYLVSSAPVVLPVTVTQPTVSAEQVATTVELLATPAVSGPVTVTAATVTTSLQPDAIAKALTFTVKDGALAPELNGTVLHKAIAKPLAPLEVGGKNASFVIKNNKPVIVPSKIGRGVSDQALAAAVLLVLSETGDREVSVEVGQRQPKLSTEAAKKLGVVEKLSTFTQNYPYAPYRSQNIGRAAELMNGTLVMPGAIYSMNGTIKERTRANGYTTGFVIGAGGIFREDLGGGVSTATTAMWTAGFYAGVARDHVQAHSIWISRYRAGLEATVAWGQFDMTWLNDTGHAIYIQSSTTDTSVKVTLWGTKKYDKVTAESGSRTNYQTAKTVYSTAGDCRSQGSVEGFSIVVDRVFWSGGKEVRREPIKTTYRPSPRVVCGPDPSTVKPTPKPKPSPSPTTGAPSAPSSTPAATPAPKPSAAKPTAAKPTAAKPSSKPSAAVAKPGAKPSLTAARPTSP